MIVRESLLRDVLRLIIWFPFRWLIYLLPVSVSLFIYRRMGDIHYYFNKKKSAAIETNIKNAFKDRKNKNELLDIVRENMQSHYIDRLIIFLFPKLNKDNIENFVSIEGLDFLDAALAKKKGCILVHPHFGPAQLSLCALGHKGYKMNQLGYRTTDGLSYIGREVQAKTRLKIEENKIPARMLYVNKFMRPLFTALNNNEVLMTAGDAGGATRFVGKYITAKFFGNDMHFPTGWVSLAQKTGASVLPLSLYQNGRNKYKVVIHAPIHLETQTDDTDNILENVEKFVKILEEDVRTYPHQWHFWDEFFEGNLLVKTCAS
ncbi:MAG: lysophospholipid acyltransferase family protein [Planctomycetes bacterium]|nr:lysophospholipid acyltransferase family protein [Planctomycetota bacterium]